MDWPPYFHINTVEGRSIKDGKYIPSEFQRQNINKWNHLEISDDAYQVLKNFDGVAKKAEVAGRRLAVAGAALDALELLQTINIDIHDADRKIGRLTYSAAASIGGSWALGTLDAWHRHSDSAWYWNCDWRSCWRVDLGYSGFLYR